MKPLVPYAFLESISTDTGIIQYELNILIHYPEDKHIIKLSEFPAIDSVDNPFEYNVYKFSYKVMDGDIDTSLFDSIIPNFYTETINLSTLLPTIPPADPSRELVKGDKVVRAEGFLGPNGIRRHTPKEFLHDRFSILLYDEGQNGQEFLRAITVVTDFADLVAQGPGEPGPEGSGGGHPFI